MNCINKSNLNIAAHPLQTHRAALLLPSCHIQWQILIFALQIFRD